MAGQSEERFVMLRGGHWSGVMRIASPAPRALRLYGEGWSELYLYMQGETEVHPEHGRMPVMVFMGRDDEPTDAAGA